MLVKKTPRCKLLVIWCWIKKKNYCVHRRKCELTENKWINLTSAYVMLPGHSYVLMLSICFMFEFEFFFNLKFLSGRYDILQ